VTAIVAVGGGYSGAAFAIHASRVAPQPLEIVLVEPRARLGPGLAHSTEHPDHRLNAADSIHLLYLDDPDHFSTWLRTSGALTRDPEALAVNGRIYPRRSDFGAYVNAELARHQASNPSGSVIRHVRRRAVRIETAPAGFRIRLDDGTTLEADACVLAPGQGGPNLPAVLRGAAGHPDLVVDPWGHGALRRVERDRAVLILGTGLTAADVVAALVARGHRGRIEAVSRHGLRPTTHSPFAPTLPRLHGLMQEVPDFVARHGVPDTVRGIVRALRSDIAGLDPARASWHAPFDEMRDAAHVLWPHLAPVEQRRFLRHLKLWYDVHRFRIPPQTARIVQRALDAGALAFLAARTLAVESGPGGFEVVLQERAGAQTRTATYATLVNCTGFDGRLAAATDPVLRQMAADGLLQPSPSGLGVAVDAHSRAFGTDGVPHPKLHVVGPLTAGSIGEAASVPVITRQVLQLMPQLFADLGIAPGSG